MTWVELSLTGRQTMKGKTDSELLEMMKQQD
jgi:hypothetical protein